MRWVDALPFGVHGCTAIPFVAKDEEGFFDLQNDTQFTDPAFVSATAVKEMAAKLGWHAPGVVGEKDTIIADLEETVAQLEAELSEADKFQSNIDGLTKTGFMVKRAPGRPPKAKAA